MRLKSLTIMRVRNLREIHIKPTSNINIIYGENAAGKTAILESIYLLSKARSFRTPHIREVIQHKQKDLSVSATVTTTDDRLINTGIKRSPKETQIKYNNTLIKTVSQQSKNIVIQTAIPDNINILTGSPKDRRKWIDWSLFYVEQDYLQVWHSYYKALRNRNALLRKATVKAEEFTSWETVMDINAQKIVSMWQHYIDCLHIYYQETASAHDCAKVKFTIKHNHLRDNNFLKTLRASRQSDINAGYTQHGPHKAEIEFKIKEYHARSIFSGGQSKLFIFMLSLAQARLLLAEKKITPIILVDDLNSELDKKTIQLLLDLFIKERIQIFITTTDTSAMKTSIDNTETGLFHVEHGSITSQSSSK